MLKLSSHVNECKPPGSGLAELEQFMQTSEARFPDKFRGWVGFSVPMVRRCRLSLSNPR